MKFDERLREKGGEGSSIEETQISNELHQKK